MQALVLCVGNQLVGDDAFGWHVYQRLASAPLPPGVRLRFAGLSGLAILDHVQGEPLMVLVDALRGGGPPGALQVLPWRDLPEAAGYPVTSHDIGPREAIEIGYTLYPEKMPARAILLGVAGRCFDQAGAPLSSEVEAAVGPAADEILRQIARGDDRTGDAPEGGSHANGQ